MERIFDELKYVISIQNEKFLLKSDNKNYVIQDKDGFETILRDI